MRLNRELYKCNVERCHQHTVKQREQFLGGGHYSSRVWDPCDKQCPQGPWKVRSDGGGIGRKDFQFSLSMLPCSPILFAEHMYSFHNKF